MANDFYNHSGYPAQSSFGSSSSARSEFQSIATGFDKLPAMTGNGSKLIRVNAAATALEASGLQVDSNNALQMGDNQIVRPVVKDYGITHHNIGNSGSSFTVDLENGNVQEVTLTANATMTISNPPVSGTFGGFRLIVNQDGTGNRTLTQPGSVETNGGDSLTVTTAANAKDVIDYFTTDGGTSYVAAFYVQGVS